MAMWVYKNNKKSSDQIIKFEERPFHELCWPSLSHVGIRILRELIRYLKRDSV